MCWKFCTKGCGTGSLGSGWMGSSAMLPTSQSCLKRPIMVILLGSGRKSNLPCPGGRKAQFSDCPAPDINPTRMPGQPLTPPSPALRVGIGPPIIRLNPGLPTKYGGDVAQLGEPCFASRRLPVRSRSSPLDVSLSEITLSLPADGGQCGPDGRNQNGTRRFVSCRHSEAGPQTPTLNSSF